MVTSCPVVRGMLALWGGELVNGRCVVAWRPRQGSRASRRIQACIWVVGAWLSWVTHVGREGVDKSQMLPSGYVATLGRMVSMMVKGLRTVVASR